MSPIVATVPPLDRVDTGGPVRRLWTAVVLAATTLVVTGTVAMAAPAAVAATAPAGNPIGYLDPVTGHGSSLRTTGWAIDGDTSGAIDVFITIDGVRSATGTADVTRQGLDTRYPSSGAAHGFDITVDGVVNGNHGVCAWAVNVGTGDTTLFGCATYTTWTDPTGVLDGVSAASGVVSATGYALDPDTAAPISVQIFVDGLASGIAAADLDRPQVATSFPGWGSRHGFSVTATTTGQGNHTVCVTALNAGPGTNSELGCRTVLSWVLPTGNLESATGDHDRIDLAGWAIDPDTADAISVDIKVDGASVVRVQASGARADIARTYPDWGANHGFTASVGPFGQGSHTVCAYGVNVGAGDVDSLLGCRTVTLWLLPVGAVDPPTVFKAKATVTGWALDPDTVGPVTVKVTEAGRMLATGTAGLDRPEVGTTFPVWGSAHGFSVTVAKLTSGLHTLCVSATNVGAGSGDTEIGCREVTVQTDPIGQVESVTRTSATTARVVGWTIDPDSTGPASVVATVNGTKTATFAANVTRTDVGTRFPYYGPAHGFSRDVPVTADRTALCLTTRNLGPGADVSLGCFDIARVGATAPAAPPNVRVQSGFGKLTVTWDAPTDDGGSAVTGYRVSAFYTDQTITTTATDRSATFTGLRSGTTYGFALYAVNAVAFSPMAFASGSTQADPPPQTSVPTVSTSRYLRALNGGSGDTTSTYAMGRADAARNTSGHSYVVLLDIGGQYNDGVLLSAVAKYLSNADLVTALKAYVDGYASAMQPSAPVTIAIGTNNDTQTTNQSGRLWATAVVNPMLVYATDTYDGISIAGANDIEPGFRNGPAATRDWLSGYLASTSATFINNGSADGCGQTSFNTTCNNGWTMSDLYWLSAGAAPARIYALPQVYYTSMARQWKYISLTGQTAGLPQISFGGALTEVQACAQAGSCYSMQPSDAWSYLWSQLRSDARIAPSTLPWATDLLIS